MQEGQNGAEALAVLMRAVYEPLVRAVYAQGGFITFFAGDAFTALFPTEGTPWQLEPPAAPLKQRALAAAWAIRAHMVENGRIETPYATFDLGVKLGMAAGAADWGIITVEDGVRAAAYFRGPSIDASAAAEKFAGHNDLILAPAVNDEVAELVTGEPIEDHFCVRAVTQELPDKQPFDLSTVPYERQEAFYPDSVLAQTHSGEFRGNINVFINIQGDPSREQLTHLVRQVFDLQVQYGGVLNRIDFGDKGCSLLLFWGAPVSYENDVQRALNFTLALQDATNLSLRAGVTTSIAHTGFIGSELHEEYTCYGIGVNMSARLMTGAPWDSIWVDEVDRPPGGQRF